MIELQQYAKKNKPNLHILSKLQEEMKRLAEERVSTGHGFSIPLPPRQGGYQAVSHYDSWGGGWGGVGSCPIVTHHWLLVPCSAQAPEKPSRLDLLFLEF